jgi:hypothetical protein
MKVRCTSRKGTSLPELYLDPSGGYMADTIFPLQVGKNYVVYALTLRRGGVWYYLLDESGVGYPVWFPAPLFEVSDSKLSKYWVFGFHEAGLRAGDAVFAFAEWANDPLNFYDGLSDGRAEIRSVFQRYRELMDVEFDNETAGPIAEDLGDGWMMCSNCREAWQTSVNGPLLKCPHCATVLKNPRLSAL